MPGYQIPYKMWSDSNYVVLKSSKRLKQVATRSGLMKERPKVSDRRGLMEFGILQYLKKYGERRNRSTTLISRKGSSLTQLTNSELSGSYESQHLLKLKKDLSKGLKATNLSLVMSDPNFLIACWFRIRSKKGSLTLAFDDSIDGIHKSWFIETASIMRNGGYKFQVAKRKYITKSHSNNLCFLTMTSSKDKIVQEGMRFLLEIIFEPLFKDSSYGWGPKWGCLTALNDIRMKCKSCTWYIKGDINQRFSTINHHILIKIIKTKVDDQAFIDLLYKYIKIGYGENIKHVTPMKVEVIEGGILSPMLANIYMHPFDEWVEDYLIPNFNKGIKCNKNSEYFKKYYESGLKIKDKSIRSILTIDPNWKRVYYFRYAYDFIFGVDASKNDCVELKNNIKHFLQTKLNIILNLDKIKVTNAQKDLAKFLGYDLHKTIINKMPIRKDKSGRLRRIVSRPILDSPIKDVVQKLIERKYATKAGKPTRNARFINYQLPDIINHYRAVERGILNYYSLANNYGNLASRVHFILKYSCILTIASKMKLKTKKKVFKKYGKYLKILNDKGKIIASYPTVSYKRPIKIPNSVKRFEENFIEKIDKRVSQEEKDLKGPLRNLWE
jgi:retron-type reverse transcriptase